MNYLPMDTHPVALRVYYDVLRKIPPQRKAELALVCSNNLRAIAESGVRAAYPDFDERQVQREIARRMLGADLFKKVYTDRGL